MTETFNRTGTHMITNTTFGGLIYSSDFNTDYRGKNNTKGSEIAKRIDSDKRFDEMCRKNIENLTRRKDDGKINL